MDYHDSEGLLKSIRYPNGDFRLYNFDKNGCILDVSSQTGKRISLNSKPCHDLTKNSQCVELLADGALMQKIRIDQSGTVVFHEQKGKENVDISISRLLVKYVIVSQSNDNCLQT